jgi:hypothetical protein
VTNQFPREPGMKPTEGEDPQVDAAARLANLAPRTPSLSIFTRRDGAAAAAAEESPSQAASAGPSSSSPTAGIGRLIRVPASALWTDGAAMAAWLASTPAALMDAAGVDVERLDSPDSKIVLGTSKSGQPVCVVCEAGPSSDEGLGVLLRIAAVQDGGTVVWMTGEPSDSHVAALSWLNRSTSPRFSLVRVTGVRIDGSASAPIFTLVVRPARTGDGASTETAAPAPVATPQRRVEDHLPED